MPCEKSVRVPEERQFFYSCDRRWNVQIEDRVPALKYSRLLALDLIQIRPEIPARSLNFTSGHNYRATALYAYPDIPVHMMVVIVKALVEELCSYILDESITLRMPTS